MIADQSSTPSLSFFCVDFLSSQKHQRWLLLKLACTKLERLTEVKYCNVLIIFRLFVVLRVLRLIADRMFHLPIFLGIVVFPGPHCDVLGMEMESAVSGSEDLISGEDGTSTGSLEPRHRQSDMPGIFIPLYMLSSNNTSASVGSSAPTLSLGTLRDRIVRTSFLMIFSLNLNQVVFAGDGAYKEYSDKCPEHHIDIN